MLIKQDTSILAVLRAYPQAREVFVRQGMSCIGCMGSAEETIANGAKMHNVDLAALLQELNRLAAGEGEEQ